MGLRVLIGQGAQIDATTAAGRLVFGIFAALAEFERELIRERILVGLTDARARGRNGGRTFALSKAQVRLAQAAMAHRDTTVSALCRKLGITPVALYRYVGPQGQLREQGKKVLAPRIGARQRGRVGVRTSCGRPRGGLLWAARVSAASCIVSFRILPIG